VIKNIFTCLALSFSLFVYAGGNPEYVAFPEGYKSEFTQYDTRNRSNGTQVAVMYANKAAIDSADSGKLAEGSKIVMEVYKLKLGEDEKPITGTDGVYEKGKFAAIAVMEKRSYWDENFNPADRTKDWGFAIYNTDGTPKENKLECTSCHTPYESSDYMFTYSSLLEFIK
jgi:cytochrome P460